MFPCLSGVDLKTISETGHNMNIKKYIYIITVTLLISCSASVMALESVDVSVLQRPVVSYASTETRSLVALKTPLKSSFKAWVVVFLSVKCPCSNGHLSRLKALQQRYHEKGFVFVGVHSNADESSAQDYFRDQQLGFPVIDDRSQVLANAFSALKTPHIFVVESTGRVLYQGGVDDCKTGETPKRDFLADALADLTAGRVVQVREGKVLGCRIARP